MKETSKKIMEKRIQQVVEKETINLWNNGGITKPYRFR